MKDFDLTEVNEFELELEIYGDLSSSNPPLMLFTLLLEKMRLSFEAKKIDNGVYKVVLPVMKQYLSAGEYNFQVEVIMDGKHFIAIEDKVKFKELKPVVKIKDKSEKPVEVKEKPKIEVKVSEKKKENKDTGKEKEEIKEKIKEEIQEPIFPQIRYIKTISV
jgi:hypothetical protein